MGVETCKFDLLRTKLSIFPTYPHFLPNLQEAGSTMVFSSPLMATPSFQLLRPKSLALSLTQLLLSPPHLVCQEILSAALSKSGWTPSTSPHLHHHHPHPRHSHLLPGLLQYPLTFCFPLPSSPSTPSSLFLHSSQSDSIKI